MNVRERNENVWRDQDGHITCDRCIKHDMKHDLRVAGFCRSSIVRISTFDSSFHISSGCRSDDCDAKALSLKHCERTDDTTTDDRAASRSVMTSLEVGQGFDSRLAPSNALTAGLHHRLLTARCWTW